MEYRIDREALDEFIGRQVELVESASVPKLLAEVVELRLRHESVSRDEVRALWLGAGLATHVGLAIFEEPERFVIAAPVTRHARRGARRLTAKEAGRHWAHGDPAGNWTGAATRPEARPRPRP